jgi:hypothetical protein
MRAQWGLCRGEADGFCRASSDGSDGIDACALVEPSAPTTMAVSPHQPKSLADRISDLKEELIGKKALRAQIEALGQTTSAAGMSTTYVSYRDLVEDIRWTDHQIEALTAQLNGDPVPVPGIVLQQSRSDYV